MPTLKIWENIMFKRGFVSVPLEGNLSFGNLTIDFLVDEDLRNYMEIHNWIRALGAPDNVAEK